MINQAKHFPFGMRTIWIVDGHRDDGTRFVVRGLACGINDDTGHDPIDEWGGACCRQNQSQQGNARDDNSFLGLHYG